MALSLLWFQLLQPLRRLFFWPKIYKKTLFILSLWKLPTETTTKRNVHLVALFFPCTKKSLSLSILSPVLLFHTGGQHSAAGSAELCFGGFEELSRADVTSALRLLSFPQMGLNIKIKKGLLFSQHPVFYFLECRRDHSRFIKIKKFPEINLVNLQVIPYLREFLI